MFSFRKCVRSSVRSIAYNGKSICEGRAKLDEKFNFDLSEANAFFVELNYKKMWNEKAGATKCNW